MAEDQRLTSKSGDKLDLLLWRDAGLGPGHITRVLDANPGLADLGPILPLGTVVIVPGSVATPAPSVRPIIQLWS